MTLQALCSYLTLSRHLAEVSYSDGTLFEGHGDRAPWLHCILATPEIRLMAYLRLSERK